MSKNLPYTTHITNVGESTMAEVAQKNYGDSALWPKVHEANPRHDPYDLKPGTHLVIPPHSKSAKPRHRPRHFIRRGYR